jgi:hypothetical protein
MTVLFSSLVALAVLGAEPDRVGLPLGIPPGPEDLAIAGVAPEKCLFYVNWAGTAAPDPKSRNEMEQLLAEPEVQVLLNSVGNWIRSSLGRGADQPVKAETDEAAKAKSAKERQERAELAAATLDLCEVWLTHPTGFFIVDVRPPSVKPAGTKPSTAKTPDAKALPEASPPSFLAEFDGHAGLIVALGSDASRVRALVEKLVKADNGKHLQPFQLGDHTWYRQKFEKSENGPPVQCGFQANYFIAAVGNGALEGILARLNNQQQPAWYTAALKQVPVPRRTGIIYLNMNGFRDLLFQAVKSQANDDAALRQTRLILEVLGLDRATSLVSTTGLDDHGMVNKVLLAIDGKPQGLLHLVSERPLQPADLAPIPRDATLALALRLDLQKAADLVLSAIEKTSPAARADAAAGIAQFERFVGMDLHRFLGALGDTWCIYNSPGEGGLVCTGLTAVVPIREAGLLQIGYAKLLGLAKRQLSSDRNALSEAGVGRLLQFRFGRYEIYYLNLLYFSPACCVTERQVILALNAHNIKAYLARRDHQPLSVAPEVAQAMGARQGPAMLLYCDTPKLFELAYPLVSMGAQAFAGGLGGMWADMGLEFWPSAPSIRRHLRPDVSTVQRTPQGIQITCRYCLPTGGMTGPLLLYAPMSCAALIPLYSGDPQRVPPPQPATRETPADRALPAPTPPAAPASPQDGRPAMPAGAGSPGR